MLDQSGVCRLPAVDTLQLGPRHDGHHRPGIARQRHQDTRAATRQAFPTGLFATVMPGASPAAQPTQVRPPPGIPHLSAGVLHLLRANGYRAYDPGVGRHGQAGLLPVGGRHDREQRLARRCALELHHDIPRAGRHQGRRAVELCIPAHAVGRVREHGLGGGRAERGWPQDPWRSRRGLPPAADADAKARGGPGPAQRSRLGVSGQVG